MNGHRPVVVTGGAGFIGSHIIERLVADDVRVVAADDLSTGSVSNIPNSVPLEQCDIAEPHALDWVSRLRPTAIVHCAAQVSVARSFEDPAADARSNIVGALRVIQAAVDAEVDHFVYLSSGGALYGNPNSIPNNENAPVAPLSPYGWSKWIVERYLQLLVTGRVGWTILRLANVYGPRQRTDGEGGVVAIFADQMRRGMPISVHGDGEQTRDFVFVRDIADAVSTCLSGPALNGVFNVGTGRETSVNQLFAQLAAIAGYSNQPIHVGSRFGDISRSVLDVSRARDRLGWSATTRLEIGLLETYAETTVNDRIQRPNP